VRQLVLSGAQGLFAVSGKVFIDTTGDGFLSMLCGVPFALGDTDGGTQAPTMMAFYADIDSNNKDEIVTHYFAGIEYGENDEKIYRSKRVNSESLDSWRINEEDLIGQYSFKINKIGKFLIFLMHPLGIIVILLDFAVIIIFILLTDKRTKSKDKKDNVNQIQ
jgi:hypothetical protein